MGVAIINAAADTLARSLDLELAPIRSTPSPQSDRHPVPGTLSANKARPTTSPPSAASTPPAAAAPRRHRTRRLFAMTNTFLTGQTQHIDGGGPLT